MKESISLTPCDVCTEYNFKECEKQAGIMARIRGIERQYRIIFDVMNFDCKDFIAIPDEDEDESLSRM